MQVGVVERGGGGVQPEVLVDYKEKQKKTVGSCTSHTAGHCCVPVAQVLGPPSILPPLPLFLVQVEGGLGERG